MAVPKKRTGKSAQAKRRANWKATVPATTKCSKCGAVVLTHTVCPECGSYKGKVVSIKNPEYVNETEVKEEPKKAKRTTKKLKQKQKLLKLKLKKKLKLKQKKLKLKKTKQNN